MALKAKISASDFDKLSDDIKKEYKKSGDDYILDVEGMDDPAELRRARDREKEAAAEAKRELAEVRSKLDALENDDNKKKGNVEALEKSYKDKIAKLETQLEERENAWRGRFEKTHRTSVADKLAAEIGVDKPGIRRALAREINDRLAVDYTGDEPITRVLKDGKPSAMSLDELKQELVASPDFAGMVVGSKGSGGAEPGKGGGGAPRFNTSKPETPLHELPTSDLRAHMAEKIAAKQ